MEATRQLARFVAETRFADLPPSLIAEFRIAVLDTLAAAFVGSTLPWARRVVEMVQELGGAPRVTVVNQPWKTDVSRAALANGAMIGAFECEPLTGSPPLPCSRQLVGSARQASAGTRASQIAAISS